jgi:pyruvate/2-oxoglutarate dehydrogenase complex dihydrolipoamide acyltransferase (E2) component
MLLIRVPEFSKSNQPISILRWHRQVGEAIGQGMILVDLQIGKDIFSLSCPRLGILEKIVVSVGKVIKANDVIAMIKDSLPAFDPEAELNIETPYAVSDRELTVSAQLALQQMLADRGGLYASRIQSLPPKWQVEQQPESENNLEEVNEGPLTHPLLADKCWRKEEHQHPSDLSAENLDQAELRYNLNYQPAPSNAPTPRPH